VIRAGVVASVVLSCAAVAVAQNRPTADLKNVPPAELVTSVSYCRGEYEVGLGDGSARQFKEYDLAFKIDTGPHGPRLTKPALVPTGRVRGSRVRRLANLDELRRSLKAGCRS